MQAPTIATEQLLIHRVGGERVGEPEQIVGDLDDDRATDELAQRDQQIHFVQSRDRRDQFKACRATEHGERVDDPPVGYRHLGKLLADCLVERPRELRAQQLL